eukprot:ANDGO_06296.mRNA.1 Coiled-coil domain-containing protein 93 homolog
MNVPMNEEARNRLDEIVEMLVAAGYFRARISSLSPFDKVIGGMAWCISNANVDVDVDVSFRENSNIGQRIKMGESITRALKRMKCPFPLQSHQIQGLDVSNIFPVIQWLVKKVIETREEAQQSMRNNSDLAFSQSLTDFSDSAYESSVLSSSVVQNESYVAALSSCYRPKRRFRRVLSVKDAEPTKKKVHLTLLEYRTSSGSVVSESKKKSPAEAQMEVNVVDADADLAEQSRMQTVADDNNRISSSVVSKIVEIQSEEIRSASADYNAKAKALEEEASRVDPSSQKVINLQKQNDQLAKRIKIATEERDAALARKNKANDDLSVVQNVTNKLTSDIENMKAVISAEDEDDIVKLRRLVASHADLQKQKELFREGCVAEMRKWKSKLNAVERDNEKFDQSGVTEAQAAFDDALQQHTRVSGILAAKSREIAGLQRKIDMVPRQVELLQYERRFSELYEQVSSKLEETRKYFNSYNTLDETRVYLSKELSLLDSIYNGFSTAMSSKQGKEKFIEQLSGIIDNVLRNKSKVDVKLDDEFGSKQSLETKFNDLLEQQRKYFMAVKEFQEECKRNEELQSRMAS